MKTAIVYKTLHGSTRQYAYWLCRELRCKMQEMTKPLELKKYDTLIIMSGTYAGRMPLIDYLKENWKEIENKKLIVIAVGAVPENSWWSKLSYLLIPGYIKKKIKYFKIYGKYDETSPPIKKENLNKVLQYIKNAY